MEIIKETELRAVVGRQLQAARVNAGLTLKRAQMAADAISAEELAQVESGRRSIRCCDIYKLLRAYSFPQEQVLFFCTFSIRGEINERH